MIEIEAPDGSIIEFPAGTDDATIDRVMRENFAPQAAESAPARGIGQRLYDNIVGDPNDGVQSTGEALGTWLNRAGESMTLGLVGDEASAARTAPIKRLFGGDATYESELARYRQNEADMSGPGRLSADISGALVPGLGMAGTIARGGNLGARMARGAATGAAAGGTYGFMEGEGGARDRAMNALAPAALGAALGGIIPAAGAGVRSLARGRAERAIVRDAARNAPSTEELRTLGNRLYQEVDDAGAQITPESFNRAKDEIRNYLRANTGFDELPGPGSLTPNSARAMSIMDEAGARMAQEPTAALPFRSLDQMRRQAGAAAGNVTNRTDQQAGTAIINQLDDYVQRLGPDDMAGGDPAALKSAITKAREVWGRMSRSQTIDDAIEQSENYLSGGASGVRNQLAKILRNPKLSRGFSDAEKSALRSALRGGILEQSIGLAGGGLGRLMQMGGGFAGGGLAGAAAGTATGQLSRALSEAMARRSIDQVRGAVASGALRGPEVMNALAVAGQRPEFLTNAALSTGNALAVRP